MQPALVWGTRPVVMRCGDDGGSGGGGGGSDWEDSVASVQERALLPLAGMEHMCLRYPDLAM